MTTTDVPTAELLDELLELASAIAREAGAMIRDGRAGGSPDAATKSTSTDVVTVFDTASERLIVERLRAARADDAILGEEGASRPGTSGIRWVVDPIDGTTNYLYGLSGYAVSIAAEEDLDIPPGEIAPGGLVGVVYLPATDELFAARRGRGATSNGVAIRCGRPADVATALIGTGFSYHRAARAQQGRRVAELLPEVRDIRRLGAAAADLCHLACGRLDGYYEQYLQPWDLAAGALIAREAGAIVGPFSGADGEPDGVLAAAPTIHSALRALIEQSGRSDHN